jgi:hypothetical protein
MPTAQALAEFKANVAQCESLIANAHKVDVAGATLLPPVDQQQITAAAFLNLFLAWEGFLETSLSELMLGGATIGGGIPVRYVSPPSAKAARELVVGVMRYFDYANHQNMRKMVALYFQHGYPFEPHLASINSDLDDLRTMRNPAAHISSTTQMALESLALRIFGAPKVGITLYQLLTAADPRSAVGNSVFATYKQTLEVTAELIANG